ncbi:MAG: aminotransferase class V-fold PLP-dependent enzyme [bacterium]|nr:aminotransferase class V-fold PLP-dependent enzyme [bacterium]
MKARSFASAAESSTRDGICGICPAGCFVRVQLESGRIEEVKPHPDHPLGMLCTIGAHSPEIVHDPDRLQTPMRRVGEKGTNEFEPISWEEAFDEIEARFRAIKAESGPEAVAIYTGRGSFELSLCDIFQPADVAVSSASSVLFPFGSPNTLGVGALCYVSFAMIAPHVTFGEMHITLDPDVDQADLVVVWGANPATDSPPLLFDRIVRASRRGTRIVSIDPRRTETAKATEAEWIAPRPGTDGALALSMIAVLIEEELYDESFVTDWTLGFEELAQYSQHFRPEVAAEITGVPPETIRRLAREIANARGAAPVMYTGLEYSDSGVQAIRAVFTLWALAGQLDVPGGLCIRMKENQFPINRAGLVPNPNVKKALGRDRFPVYSMYRGESHAIALPESVLHGDPYRIRAMMILGGSIITAWPEPAIWRDTLDALDFLVCVDRYLTADAAHADIVLPATTLYEIDSYMVYGPMFALREKLIEPVGDARDDFHILTELARRLGYGDLYPQGDEARLRYVLEGSGFSLEDVREAGGEVRIETAMMQYKKWEKGGLREDGQTGFATPSGKFEIASSILEEHGYDPLPIYTEVSEGPIARPDLARKYPLVFNSGARIFADFRSQHHGVAILSERARDPQVTLHVEDARTRGIESGAWVWVETPRGRARFRADVTDDIVPGAIDANMGGGGPLGSESWQECNVNDLTDLQNYDPISGFPVYKALLCEVVPCDAGPAEEQAQGGGPDAGDHPERNAEHPPETRDSLRSDAPGGGRAPTLTPEPERREVYLDHNASTPVAGEVLQAMLPFLGDEGGNPSSIHGRGAASRLAVEAARRGLANLINCTARRIVFTAGGTEANNLAIQGVARSDLRKGGHLITSAVEHPAVLETCTALDAAGFETTILPVDSNGLVDPSSLEAALRPDTVLVSVMLANNELGTIQPIAELAKICHEHGVLIHTDAVQALGKIPVDVDDLGVDLLSVSSHKLNGPKGVGALYVKRGLELLPLMHGGGQERGLRAGTENVAGIVGFGKACELAQRRENAGGRERVASLRDRLERGMCRRIEGARISGAGAPRTPNTANLVLPGMRGESLVLALDRHGVYFSSGSACKSGNPDPSHVLRAVGLSDEDAHCSVRLSLGVGTTGEDIEYVLEVFDRVIEHSQSALRFVGCR